MIEYELPTVIGFEYLYIKRKEYENVNPINTMMKVDILMAGSSKDMECFVAEFGRTLQISNVFVDFTIEFNGVVIIQDKSRFTTTSIETYS